MGEDASQRCREAGGVTHTTLLLTPCPRSHTRPCQSVSTSCFCGGKLSVQILPKCKHDLFLGSFASGKEFSAIDKALNTLVYAVGRHISLTQGGLLPQVTLNTIRSMIMTATYLCLRATRCRARRCVQCACHSCTQRESLSSLRRKYQNNEDRDATIRCGRQKALGEDAAKTALRRAGSRGLFIRFKFMGCASCLEPCIAWHPPCRAEPIVASCPGPRRCRPRWPGWRQ